MTFTNNDWWRDAVIYQIYPRSFVELIECAKAGIHITIVGNIITSIRQRRWIEWRKPERVHPERLQIVETIDHALEITVAVSIGIAE